MDFERALRELLDAGVGARFRAPGRSMAPWIRDGEAITVLPARAGELRPLDVVLYEGAHGPVAHRLLTRLPDGSLRLGGDAEGSEPESVEPFRVLGVVTAVEREGRTRTLRTAAAKGRWLLWRAGRALAEGLRPLRARLQPAAR